MTTISRPRVDAGVPAGGEFKAYGHSDAVLSLPAPAPSDAIHGEGTLYPEDVFAHAAAYSGPGVVPAVERQYAMTTTETGRQLLLQKLDAYYNRESEYAGSRPSNDLTPQRCDQLAELGYTDIRQVSGGKVKNLYGINSITENGITPDRLEIIGRFKRHESQWSAWEKEAYLTAPVEDLDALTSTDLPTPKDEYLATMALLGTEKYTRARDAMAVGIKFRGLIEADHHSPELLHGLYQALPTTKSNAWNIVQLADKGITPDHLKKYGTKACETFSGKDLDASGLKPAVIKGLVASGVRGDLAYYRQLHTAGYTKGSDLKDASRALETTDVTTLTRARRHASGEQMALFKGATKKKITLDDARAIGRLAKAGIDEPDQLRTWTTSIHAEANRYIDRDQSLLAIHADFIEAGVTPERLGEITRAGIPVTEAAAHAKTQDLWAAGKTFRDEYAATEQRRFEQRWIREPKPWAFTEATYRDGAGQ
ncbi:hypothetical protein [Pseudarthrobacter sp. BIM B-2242]|uniref:hypothetical protein n=1 Tax=Pseudarthrobacter sp. BIM B-2242 TaxID=2772401 RepID=UPI00168B5A06|nr:hypothetical protein [Pseudarthrobacter sp. BIM B-2242]QOD05650.1 hypothetical protein IDT60_21650 [Pseudarthrobacter sp. BIM B-2242]